MKWNQKGIIACVVLFFVIIGALMVQGVQKTNNQEDAHYASEEDVVSVEKGDGETGINKIGRTNKDSQAENGSKHKYTKREN